MGLDTSPESPTSVRTASRLMGEWIRRTGAIWVEGQIAELNRRRSVAWITLRDTDADMSLPLMAPIDVVDSGLVAEGHRVVALLKADYFAKNGAITWRVREFRPVGLGALLQRLEELRRTLAAEGLFAEERKRPLPFLPRRVGLVCGRGSDARHDVEVNARAQWPATVFEVREVAVQGTAAVPQVVAAVQELDALTDVDVIVIARGGGSFEDLLPFSNETLLRAVVGCATPVVSAIGHEADTPLLDHVADRRASTPTAAGRMVVPDLADESRRVSGHRERMNRLLTERLHRERLRLENLRGRPALAAPGRLIETQRQQVELQEHRGRRAVLSRLAGERGRLATLALRPAIARPAELLAPRTAELDRLRSDLRRTVRAGLDTARRSHRGEVARLRALSPQATLERGYAVVLHPRGSIVRDPGDVSIGDSLDIRIARGRLAAVVAPSLSDNPGEPT